MRAKAKLLFAVGVVTVLLAGALPANADHEPDHAAVIGEFRRFGSESELTEDRIEENAQGFMLDAPAFASEMRVDRAYLDERLPGWAADEAFDVAEGEVVFDGENVQFSEFVLDGTPRFTMGSDEVLKFESRPMWVSVEEVEGGLKVIMDDGDATGQRVSIAKDWIHAQGMHRPVVKHESGENLTVRSEGDSFTFEMPHFSWVLLTPADITVNGRTTGAPFPNVGLVQWNPATNELKVDVGLKTTSYDLLVEKEWFDLNIPHPAIQAYRFAYEAINGEGFYVVPLLASQTPTTVHWKAFAPSATPMWTYGDPSTILTHAFNESLRLLGGPALLATSMNATGLLISVGGDVARHAIATNISYLDGLGIAAPQAARPNNGARLPAYVSFAQTEFVLEAFLGDALVSGGANLTAVEHRTLTALLAYNATLPGFEVLLPAYTPYLIHGLRLHLLGLPWSDPDQDLASLAVKADGQLIGGRNRTHYWDGHWATSENATFRLAPMVTPPNVETAFYGSTDEEPYDTFTILWDRLATLEAADAGLVSRSADQCRTVFGDLTSAKDEGSTAFTLDDTDLGWYHVLFHYPYSNSCSDYENDAYYEWSFGGRGPSIMGNAIWRNTHGTTIRGETAFYLWNDHHVITVEDPSVVMRNPVWVSGGSFTFGAGGVSTDAEWRLDDCPTFGDAVVTAILSTIISLPVRRPVLVLSYQECIEALNSHTMTYPGEPSWVGQGGQIDSSEVHSSGKHMALGFWSEWSVWASSETIVETFHMGQVAADETYKTCPDVGFGCDLDQKPRHWNARQWNPTSLKVKPGIQV